MSTREAFAKTVPEEGLRVALMQPYFFPYVGYFQLMHAVDCFVFYDDAQFSKGGWINRNRLLVDGRPGWWTFPLVAASHRQPISSREYQGQGAHVARLVAQVEHAYRRAPHFATVFPFIVTCLGYPERGVADFNRAHLESLGRHMELRCRFIAASELDVDPMLRGQARVIETCRILGATQYINSPGGQGLYDTGAFAEAGLQLLFLQPRPEPYAQFGQAHVPSLSIVDALMFNGIRGTQRLLHQYELVGTPGVVQ